MSEPPFAVEMKDIVIRFPGVLANDHVNLTLQQGEIHALLGENGQKYANECAGWFV